LAHYLKIFKRENIGAAKDRRLLELDDLSKDQVTEMKGDEGPQRTSSSPPTP
jgi:predicted component of type VI protein secretion system